MPSIVAGSPTPRGARLGAASVKEPASRDTSSTDDLADPETSVKVTRSCFLANSSTELAARDPEVVGCARTTYQAVDDCFTNAVARAVAEGCY